jgi:Neurotransmitter-gated ion-channel ligand binding domain
MSGEKLLIKRLLENYETIGIVGRPVYNTSETISVQYGIGLIQILDLNEKDQILTTNVWCRYVS